MPLPIQCVDEGLYEYCTPREKQILQAINKHQSTRAAAKILGVGKTYVQEAVKRVKAKASLVGGYSPEHDLIHKVAPGFMARGHSSLYVPGKVGPQAQWVKTKIDDTQREQIIRAAVTSLMEDIPRKSASVGPIHADEDLCNVITVTDAHVGAYSWGKETGADWDLSIAEDTLTGAVEYLLQASPIADVCVISQLGDFLHQDGLAAVTPTSGHHLDSDSRFSKVVGTAIRILRSVIDMALQNHKKVIVLMAEGNHDIASSVWLRHMFGLLYEQDLRVQVIDSELPYYAFQHGQTFLGWHHGHLRKVEQLPLLFAAQFPKIWGETSKRYVHTGHLHHKYEQEHSGITVIQHPTIAARDAYAARGGWIADREMNSITYSAKGGQVFRATVCPEMLG
jgi:hypothetical protein